MLYDADDMEAISYDTGVGEEAANESPVGTGQVDADQPYLLAALELTEVASQVLATASFHQIEDSMVLQITQGRHHLVATMQAVLIDTQYLGTVHTRAFAGLQTGELFVDPPYRRLSQLPPIGQSRTTDPVLVILVDTLAEGLTTLAPGQDPG